MTSRIAPCIREVSPAPDPWEAFIRISSLPYAIFLDSASFSDKAAMDPLRGRYSYVAADPFEVVSSRVGGGQENPAAHPLQEVSKRLRPWASSEVEGLPPFQGGAAGFFGYGLSRAIERLPPPRIDELELPDILLGIYDWVLAFDHLARTCHLISQGFPAEGTARDARARARADAVLDRLLGDYPSRAAPVDEREWGAGARRRLSELAPSYPCPGADGLLSNLSQEAYLDAVRKAIEYIRAGDIFQVNLSQRLLYPQELPPLELYRRLRERNPAPYAGYFDAGCAVIASSSPEQFLTLQGSEVITRPIKGTRPRGYTPEADSYGLEALRESEKDRAENVMIVDLLRNDLSRVSKPHTVVVPRLFETERHPTVLHLVSEVRSRLRDGLDAMDLLRATFPGGSITGAPKVRAMEIISELEPTARGPYCGSMGWIAFHGGMGLNILIRTVTAARGWLHFPVGGGIVAMSDPEVEYQETMHKAEGMLRALAT